jgi:hypothetical protein
VPPSNLNVNNLSRLTRQARFPSLITCKCSLHT